MCKRPSPLPLTVVAPRYYTFLGSQAQHCLQNHVPCHSTMRSSGGFGCIASVWNTYHQYHHRCNLAMTIEHHIFLFCFASPLRSGVSFTLTMPSWQKFAEHLVGGRIGGIEFELGEAEVLAVIPWRTSCRKHRARRIRCWSIGLDPLRRRRHNHCAFLERSDHTVSSRLLGSSGRHRSHRGVALSRHRRASGTHRS